MTPPFRKEVELSPLSPHEEPRLQILRPGEPYGSMTKTGSEALEYIKHVKPIPGKTIILVLAMTAGDYYGPNRNGDGWPEHPLEVNGTKITADDVLPKHYQTFEDGHVFQHHVNKDPAKSIGDVLKSFYNWPMHRVELLLALDNEKAQKIIQKIENGDFPAVSMGCRIKFDVCSICGHKAPSTDKYCQHAKNQLGRILPNGRWVFVWNPSPRFFDISAVIRPADRIGYMLKKVAEANPGILPSAVLGAYLDNTGKKIAALGKLSVLHKLINGMGILTARQSNSAAALDQLRKQVAEPAAEKMPELGDDTLRMLSKHRPAKVFSTLSSMGILLTTPEFIKFFIWQLNPTMEVPDEVLDRAVALQGKIFEFLSDHPNLIDEIDSMNYLKTGSEHVDSELAEDLRDLIPIRSQQDHLLYKRAVEAPKLSPTGLGYVRNNNATQLQPGFEKIAGTAALFASAYALSPWDANTDLIVEPYAEIGHEGVYSKYAGFDTANAAVRLAMDQQHRQLEKKAICSSISDIGADISLEEAISLVGKAVCS